MSQWNSAIEVTFNDNDGKVGWRVHPGSIQDYRRHCRIFGIWRTRWILFKKFWRGLQIMEIYASKDDELCGVHYWKFKAEIPE